MTKDDFLETMKEVELLTGRSFSQEFLDGRYLLVKNLDAERFHAAVIASVNAGKDPFLTSVDPQDTSPE